MNRFTSSAVSLAIALFARGVFAEVDDGSVLHTGEATYYGDTTFGHCGFPAAQQQFYHGAMNHEDYDTAAPCGAWVHIAGPLGEVTAFIDDECPECKKGDIDLGPRTFAVIGDLKDGRIPISWRYVEAPITGPIQYFWKDGSSQWHIEVQIRNHRYAIKKVEICIPPDDWIAMPRKTYNFFVLEGGVSANPGPYTMRVTDILGQQLVDSNVALAATQVVDGKANFPEKQADILSQPRPGGKRVIDRSACHVVSIWNGFPERYCPLRSAVELFTLSGKSMGVFTASELTSKRLDALCRCNRVVVAHSVQNQ
jgi:expansin